MLIETVPHLLDALKRVELFLPDQIDEIVQELAPMYEDPVALANHLIQSEWLTPYQCDRLFEGDWKSLVVGSYHLLEPLGEGGVGQVFKAWDCIRGRVVALKVMRQDLTSEEDAARQFHAELQAITRLNHPNVIRTFDAHRLNDVHYFAMEYIQGIDLHRYVNRKGSLPIPLACECIRHAAMGLQHAHQVGLVHRDIKPANLFLVHPPSDPRSPLVNLGSMAPLVKVLDWGLARLLPKPGERSWADAELDPERGLLMGTADYIAPEQAQDASLVDTRGDIYSLGCSLYFLLTGHPPFPGGSIPQKILRHLEAEPVPVQKLRPDVPAELANAVARMMAKNPDKRQQIPLLVVADLRPFCALSCGSNHGTLRTNHGSGSILRPPSTMSIKSSNIETAHSRPQH